MKKINKTEQLHSLLSGHTYFVLPKKLVIFGETYKINILKEVVSNGKKVNGYFSPLKKEINLKLHDNMNKSFFHELLHLRNHLFGYIHTEYLQVIIDSEMSVRLEALFWKQVFEQIYPIKQFFDEYVKQSKTTENKKDKLILKLEKENKILKEKLKKEVKK